ALTFDGTNLSVGGTSPSNAGYTNLYLNNTSGAQLFLSVNGVNSRVLYSTATSLNYYTSDASPHVWQISGVEEMRLTSTGLGIGTSSPSNKLHVVYGGSAVGAQFTASAGYAQMQLTAAGANQNAYYTFNVNGSGKGIIQINATDVLTLDSSGNLGLGVTPSAWDTTIFRTLQIGGGAGSASVSGRTDGANNVQIGVNYYYGSAALRYVANGTASYYNQQNGAHSWYTAASGTAGNAITFSQVMTLDASGNLGVGTTTPGAKLDVQGNLDPTYNSNILINSLASTCKLAFNPAGGFSSGIVGLNDGGIGFNAAGANTERARIDSSGNLLVGTTTAVAQITSVSSSASNAAGYFNVNAASSTAIPAIYGRKYDNDNTTSQIYMSFQYNQGSGGAGGIQGNNATGVQFYSSSDARLKENIVELESQLQNIMSLKPSKFDYIDGPKNCTGFIAQQIEVVYPDVIGTTTDGYKTIGGISIMETRLIKAIQEQQALIESLTSRVSQLEGTQP
ncbi:hypothetical protein EBS40_09420, partial [bacterium]|nr:hypothetical protein [bacterium]